MGLSAGRPSKTSKSKELELSDFSDESQAQKTRVNFMLETEKHQKLKQYALNNRRTVTDILIEMIDERLSER